MMSHWHDQLYNIPKARDPNIKWEWWLEFQEKKRVGDIDPTMPGWLYCAARRADEEAAYLPKRYPPYTDDMPDEKCQNPFADGNPTHLYHTEHPTYGSFGCR